MIAMVLTILGIFFAAAEWWTRPPAGRHHAPQTYRPHRRPEQPARTHHATTTGRARLIGATA